MIAGKGVAVLIPCHNEEATVADVVHSFAAALPQATVYVFDNGSTDATAKRAEEAGAVVRQVMRRGKGNVVRRMFADVEADCYILVDGDGTYDASVAPKMAELVSGGCDLVNVARDPVGEDVFRPGHTFGNRLLGRLLSEVSGRRVGDVLSGYKAASRRLVKSFPVVSRGFEIEVELTVHALELEVNAVEIRAPYAARHPDSESKLVSWRDGLRILSSIIGFTRQSRPLAFFGVIGTVLALIGLALGVPLLITFAHTHLVPRLPTAVLGAAIEILAALCLTAGLILDTVARTRREQRSLAFLAIPGPMVDTAPAIPQLEEALPVDASS